MQLLGFFKNVEKHPELKGVSINEHRAMVLHVPSDVAVGIPLGAIERYNWVDLEAFMCGRREARALRHMTRVVGYYSRVENWNKSKEGELKDRQKGNYMLPEPKGHVLGEPTE